MKTQLHRLTSAARALLLLAALFLALPALRAANALPPEKMSYQGFLVDANGVPLGSNAPVNHVIEFRIYNVSSGGTAIWGEYQTVTIDKGYFSVMLGDGTPLGTPVALSTVFSGSDASDRFIGVKGTSGSLANSAEILPRLRLVTSPYAYMATTLPPGAITNGLFAAASITGDKLATNTLTAANFSTNVGLWTANGTNIYRTNGFVGIGTATPGAPLDVLGQVQVLANGTISSIGPKNTYRGLIETSYGAGNDRYGLAQGPSGVLALYAAQSVGYIQFGQATGSNSFSPQMTIQNNGNVGIGTANPVGVLEVSAPYYATANLRLNQPVTSWGTVAYHDAYRYITTAGGDPALTSDKQFNVGAGGVSIGYSSVPGYGSSDALYVRGNVGIGTTTPVSPLDVAAGAGFDGSSNPGGIALQWSGGGFRHFISTRHFGGANNSGNAIDFYVNSTTGAANSSAPGVGNVRVMTLSGDGRVGIGTISPQAALDVNGSYGISTAGSSAYLIYNNITSYSGTPSISIRGSSTIEAPNFVALSDARIKKIIGLSEGAADLKTLLDIKVTDFTYKDIISKGNRPQKKVIAQQVEKVYPQAVSKSTDVVPDIFTNATAKGGWVQLATDLKVGERVKLMGEKEEGIHEVLEVKAGAFRTDFKPATDKVFVYGREVKDFRSVDYEAISMLNVSATQELARQVKAQETELTELRAELAKLRTEKKSLAATVTELKAQDEARESRLARLEKALDSRPAVIEAKATTRDLSRLAK